MGIAPRSAMTGEAQLGKSARASPETLRTLPAAALVVSAVCWACFEQARILTGLSTRYTHEDHGVLWTAALDWGRWRMREPTFYGQDYGVTYEAIPAALLHGLGVPYSTGLPASLVLFGLASWWACAWASWSRGWRASAFVAAACPILLSTEHSVVVSVFATGAGRFMAAAGAAMLLAFGHRRWGAAVSVAVCVWALSVDPASALMAGPALVWGGCRMWYARRYRWPVCAGVVCGLGWVGLRMVYNLRHPDHVVHPATDFTPALEYLAVNVAHPDNLLAIHTPELCQSASVLLTFVGMLMVIAMAARAWAELLAVLSYIVLLVLLASLWKSTDGLSTVWFRAARTTLMVPLGAWLLGVLVLQAARTRWHFIRPATVVGTVLMVALLTVGTAGVRAVGLREKLDSLAQVGLAERGYPLRTVEEVVRICDDVARSAELFDTHVVLFVNDDLSASFACQALHPTLITAFPPYERRFWILHRLMERTSTRMLLWNAHRKLCQRKASRAGLLECRPTGHGEGTFVSFAPQSPLRVAHALGVTPRPFGDDCHPLKRETCRFWAGEFGSLAP